LMDSKEAVGLGVAGKVAQGVGAALARAVLADPGLDEPGAEFVLELVKLVVGGGAVGDADQGVAALSGDGMGEGEEALHGGKAKS